MVPRAWRFRLARGRRADANGSVSRPRGGINRRQGARGVEIKGLVESFPRERHLAGVTVFPQVFPKWDAGAARLTGHRSMS